MAGRPRASAPADVPPSAYGAGMLGLLAGMEVGEALAAELLAAPVTSS